MFMLCVAMPIALRACHCSAPQSPCRSPDIRLLSQSLCPSSALTDPRGHEWGCSLRSAQGTTTPDQDLHHGTRVPSLTRSLLLSLLWRVCKDRGSFSFTVVWQLYLDTADAQKSLWNEITIEYLPSELWQKHLYTVTNAGFLSLKAE